MVRRKSAAVIAVLAAASLAACSSSDGGGSGDSSSSEVLKVAIFPANAGPLVAAGQDIKDAADLAVEQVNAKGGVAGHKVEIVELVTDASAAKTQQLVTRAVKREGVNFVTGIVTSPEVVAVLPQLESLNAVLISSSSKADDIPAFCNDNAVITTQTNSMSVKAVTNYLQDSDIQEWSAIGTDTVSGKAAVQNFVTEMKAQGKKVADPVYAPVGTADFGTLISKLKGQGAKGLFSSTYGTDSVAFMKQADQFGLLKTYETVAGQSFNTDQLWKPMGKPALGTVGNIGTTFVDQNQLNQDFVAAFTKKYGKAPGYSAGDSYLGFQTLFQAVEKADSIDPAKVKKAFRGLKFDSIVGDVSIRPEDGLMIRPEYVGTPVEGAGGAYEWKILKTVPGAEIVPDVKGC